MANLPFPSAPESSLGGPNLGAEQQTDATHDGAPGGLSLGDSLPTVAVPGGQPFILTGYAPQRDQDALPAPGSGLPPGKG